MVIAFPGLVTGGIEKGEKLDADTVLQQMQETEQKDSAAAAASPEATASTPAPSASAPAGEEPALADDDPMKALQDAMKADAKKK